MSSIVRNGSADLVNNANATGSWTKSYTVAASSNLVVFCVLGTYAASGTVNNISGATYGGTSCTLAGSVPGTNANGGQRCINLFYLANPPTGANNLVVSQTATGVDHYILAVAADYGGVNLVSLDGATQTATTLNAASLSSPSGSLASTETWVVSGCGTDGTSNLTSTALTQVVAGAAFSEPFIFDSNGRVGAVGVFSNTYNFTTVDFSSVTMGIRGFPAIDPGLAVGAWDTIIPSRRYRVHSGFSSGDRFEFGPLAQGYKRAYAGWETQPTPAPQPPSPLVRASRWANSEGLRFEIEPLGQTLPYVPMGWEPNVPQPPTPQLRHDQAAAIMPSEPGNEAKLIPLPFVPMLRESWANDQYPNPTQPRQRFAAIAPREDGNEAKLIFLSPTPAGAGYGYMADFQPPNPSLPRDRFAAIAPIAPGIEAKLIPLPFVPLGWEPLLHQPRVVSVRVNVAAAIMPSEPGNEARLFFGYTGPIMSGPISAGPITGGPFIPGTQIPLSPFAWDTGPPPFYQSRTQALDRAGIAVTVAGEWPLDILHAFVPMGWEIQPPQPPASPRRVAAVVIPTGEQPMDILRQFLAAGWEIQAPPPPRFPQNAQRMAAMMPYEDGIENRFTFQSPNLITNIGGWFQDFQPPRFPRPAQMMSGMMPQSQGIEAILITLPFIPVGWELQQPNFPTQIRKFMMPAEWAGLVQPAPAGISGIVFDGLSIEALPLPLRLLARRMVMVGEAAGGFPQISPLIPPAPPKPALVISGYPGVPF